MSDGITRALLITGHAPCETVYGGEILLNRALIALSKSGIRSATIVCQAACFIGEKTARLTIR